MPIEVKNLNFSYPNSDREELILNDINLEFNEGKITSILGPNGSGKSTLIKIILGLLNKNSGSVLIDQTEVNQINPNKRARIISYVPQINELDFDFTVFDIVSMGRHPYIKGLNSLSKEDIKIVEDSLKEVGLFHLKDKYVTQLSGGEKQRVSLARALTQDTKYIILDEPINHLDVKYQIDLLEVLKNKVPNKTIITVMHDINLSFRYSDEIILMKNGKVTVVGKKEDVLNKENLHKTYDIDFSILNDEDNNKIFIPKTK